MNYVLGIDIGTTNTKAVAFALDGKIIARANTSYLYSSEKEGYHELDPDILLNAVTEVIKTAVADVPHHQLIAVSFSAAMHGLIAVDKNCRPLTKMITWADLRSREYATQLKNTEAGKRIYERTGVPVHPMSPLCKLMWMRDHLPGIFNSAHKFISIKEYVFYKFFNEYLIDHSIASATGLFDIYDKIWNEEALEIAGISADKLSTTVPATHVISGLKIDLGIKKDIPFVIGASDGCLAHIGSNALKDGDVSVTIGTSGAVRIMTGQPLRDQHQRVFNYILSDGLFISGGPLNNGGNVLQWFAAGFMKKPFVKPEDFEEFIDNALSTDAGADGLVFLPYIHGERAPVWDADAKGVFWGVTSAHTIQHFMRAIMEGISFGLLGILQTLEEITGNINNIYASGGFIKSEKWVTLLAEILGRPLHITQAEDSSAAGAAIIAMKALGIINNLEETSSFFQIERTYEPNLTNTDAYKKNYTVYSALYDKLKDIKN